MTVPTTRREQREQRARTGAAAGEPAVRGDGGSARASVQVQAQASAGDRRRRGAGQLLGEVLLWLAAVAGFVCIVLVILAFTANITLIMFRTGSMSPAIPAGSVAVVQRVPAADVAVGDVVTVDRPGELPVTHRVRSVEPGPQDGQRILVLRGDANVQDDPFPYTVASVRIVRFAIPGVAPVVVALGNPFVLGGITIAASVLVGWAFWPRRERETG